MGEGSPEYFVSQSSDPHYRIFAKVLLAASSFW